MSTTTTINQAKSLDEDTINESTTAGKYNDVHVYQPAEFSDITLNIQGSNVCFKLHKYKLVTESSYFDGVLRGNPTSNTLTLPPTFKWSSTQLLHYIDLLYNKYDTQLNQTQYKY